MDQNSEKRYSPNDGRKSSGEEKSQKSHSKSTGEKKSTSGNSKLPDRIKRTSTMLSSPILGVISEYSPMLGKSHKKQGKDHEIIIPSEDDGGIHVKKKDKFKLVIQNILYPRLDEKTSEEQGCDIYYGNSMSVFKATAADFTVVARTQAKIAELNETFLTKAQCHDLYIELIQFDLFNSKTTGLWQINELIEKFLNTPYQKWRKIFDVTEEDNEKIMAYLGEQIYNVYNVTKTIGLDRDKLGDYIKNCIEAFNINKLPAELRAILTKHYTSTQLTNYHQSVKTNIRKILTSIFDAHEACNTEIALIKDKDNDNPYDRHVTVTNISENLEQLDNDSAKKEAKKLRVLLNIMQANRNCGADDEIYVRSSILSIIKGNSIIKDCFEQINELLENKKSAEQQITNYKEDIVKNKKNIQTCESKISDYEEKIAAYEKDNDADKKDSDDSKVEKKISDYKNKIILYSRAIKACKNKISTHKNKCDACEQNIKKHEKMIGKICQGINLRVVKLLGDTKFVFDAIEIPKDNFPRKFPKNDIKLTEKEQLALAEGNPIYLLINLIDVYEKWQLQCFYGEDRFEIIPMSKEQQAYLHGKNVNHVNQEDLEKLFANRKGNIYLHTARPPSLLSETTQNSINRCAVVIILEYQEKEDNFTLKCNFKGKKLVEISMPDSGKKLLKGCHSIGDFDIDKFKKCLTPVLIKGKKGMKKFLPIPNLKVVKSFEDLLYFCKKQGLKKQFQLLSQAYADLTRTDDDGVRIRKDVKSFDSFAKVGFDPTIQLFAISGSKCYVEDTEPECYVEDIIQQVIDHGEKLPEQIIQQAAEIERLKAKVKYLEEKMANPKKEKATLREIRLLDRKITKLEGQLKTLDNMQKQTHQEEQRFKELPQEIADLKKAKILLKDTLELSVGKTRQDRRRSIGSADASTLFNNNSNRPGRARGRDQQGRGRRVRRPREVETIKVDSSDNKTTSSTGKSNSS